MKYYAVIKITKIKKKIKTTANACEDMEKLDYPYIACGIVMENSLAVSLKLKMSLPQDPAIYPRLMK